ncbi:MAG: ABC transporter ATP-binding protein [Anaerolineae bacterium]|nr:ABC transporter ATP-binding protein [Anaerolineae bacterium]
MSNLAVRVEKISKQYKITQRERYKTLRDTLTNLSSTFITKIHKSYRNSNGHSNIDDDTIWALKDISFDVHDGEILGIIGRNGAGKSTLLKILSRITFPDAGRVEIYGRVGSLLEVGSGFHPELTGRENIYLNGAVLGMKRSEIDEKFDEIVIFSGVERFLDMPVKRYSSGMHVRLAFAVAAHLDTEILLLDEVLSVGDIGFQKKSLSKMENVVSAGRTVFFVSHNMAAVQSLCSRVIWLDNGKVVTDGPPEEVVSLYLKSSISNQTEQVWNDFSEAPGTDNVRLRRVAVCPEGETASDVITIRTPLVIEFEFWNLDEEHYLDLSIVITNEQGVTAFVSFPLNDTLWENPFPRGLFRSCCYIPGDLLNTGIHRITLRFVRNNRFLIYHMKDALTFEVLDSPERRRGWYGKIAGAVHPALKWTTMKLDE